MMFGVIEVFNILHNYAICSQKIHLTWYSTVIKTFAKQNRHKIAKRNLFYGFNFSFFNRQSTFHGCYCGLWKCRVIIATCVPTTATVGPPFVWMVWEWEDTNIRWHRKKTRVWDNLVSGDPPNKTPFSPFLVGIHYNFHFSRLWSASGCVED